MCLLLAVCVALSASPTCVCAFHSRCCTPPVLLCSAPAALNYGYNFGAQLALYNVLSIYLYERYGMSLLGAGALAAMPGLLNVFSRVSGSLLSGLVCRHFGMRGRLWLLWVTQVSRRLLHAVDGPTRAAGGQPERCALHSTSAFLLQPTVCSLYVTRPAADGWRAVLCGPGLVRRRTGRTGGDRRATPPLRAMHADRKLTSRLCALHVIVTAVLAVIRQQDHLVSKQQGCKHDACSAHPRHPQAAGTTSTVLPYVSFRAFAGA